MKGSRLLLALAACGVLAGAAGCEGTQTQSSPPDDPARVENASAEVGRIRMRQHTRPTSLSVDDLVVLGYMERLRLGLGSPFRLMEEVMNDSLLPESHRSIATLALLDAASQGHSYALPRSALALVGVDPANRPDEAAALHADLIEAAVLGADDTETGAEAVRIAYHRAAAEGLVDARALDVVELAIGMVRARALARSDALQLRGGAALEDAHPEELVVQYRAERRFLAEAPPLDSLPAEARPEAERQAQLLVRGIRRVTSFRREPWPPATDEMDRSYLTPASARRLSAITEGMQLPSRAPVWKTMERHAAALREACGTGAACRAVERFLERADTEESFAAEYASAAEAAGPAAPLLARAALEVSAALGPGGSPAPIEARPAGRWRSDADVACPRVQPTS
jgi:hypothetical protein